ncbi:4-hydroxythreonine-4-phosphate dehydrogenase [Gammaproteobacteria bacterium]
MDPKGYKNPRISERGEPHRKVCVTRPLRADSRERPATLKILLSKGAEKTVPFPPRPEGRGFSGTPMTFTIAPPRRLVLTPGEPAGVGPDLCLRMVQEPLSAEPVVVADPGLLERRAALLGLPLRLYPFDAATPPSPHRPGELAIVPVSLQTMEQPGRLDLTNAPYVLDTLRTAVAFCQAEKVDALVTGPVHKGVINEAGFPFTGHTEFLAALTGTTTVVMMLAIPGLRVALATTHLPLREVSAALTREGLTAVLTILHGELVRRFGLHAPRILVCGLNPHAGEGGHLGHEEIEVITPVLETLRMQGMDLVGPLPADTAFTPTRLADAAAVLAMYHDQGLPVLKHLGFGRAVNVTLGLPIVRTSVDHGTALELAGSGRADHSSLIAAFTLALKLTQKGFVLNRIKNISCPQSSE